MKLPSLISKLLNGFKKLMKSPWGLLLKISVSLGILYYFFTVIDVEKFAKVLKNISPFYLLIIILFILIRNAISAWRFKTLSSFKKEIGHWVLNKQYFIASTFNLFLPSMIGGDGVRVFLLEEEGLKKRDSLLLIVVERFLGLFTLLLISCIASFFFSAPIWLRILIWGATFVYASAIYLLLFKDFSLKFLKEKGVIQNQNTFEDLKENKGLLIKSTAISLLFQFVSVFISYLVALAFNIQIPFLPFLVFVPLVWLVTMVPISFGGIGLREAAFVYFFSLITVPNESAIIISLGSYFALAISALIGAALFFYDKIVLNIQYQFNKPNAD